MNSRTLSVLFALAASSPVVAAPPEGKGKPEALPAQAAPAATAKAEEKASKGLGKARALRVPQDEDWAAYEKARLRMLELAAELRAEQAKAGPAGRDKARLEWRERHKAELEDYEARARKLAAQEPEAESSGKGPKSGLDKGKGDKEARVELSGSIPLSLERSPIETPSK